MAKEEEEVVTNNNSRVPVSGLEVTVGRAVPKHRSPSALIFSRWDNILGVGAGLVTGLRDGIGGDGIGYCSA